MLRRVFSTSCAKSIAALPSRRLLAQCAAINSSNHPALIHHCDPALFNGARTMVTKMRGRTAGKRIARGELRSRPGGAAAAAAATTEGAEDGAKGREQTAEKGAFLLSMLPQMRGKLAPPITKDTITRVQEYLHDPANKDVPLRRLVLIDVRSFDKTQWGPTVPKAYNIPLEEVANGTLVELYEAQQHSADESARSKHMQTLEMLGMKSFIDLPQPEDNIVLFGEDADDGEFGCIIFKKLGFTNVFNYRGGIMDWFDLEYIPLRRKRREARAQK